MQDFLAGQRLVLHERPSTVYPVANGIPFLGFRVYPNRCRLKRGPCLEEPLPDRLVMTETKHLENARNRRQFHGITLMMHEFSPFNRPVTLL